MNLVILKQMIRLSRIILEIREARAKLSSVNSKASYFIVDGEYSSLLKQQTNQSIANCLYTEQYLRLSVGNACKCLDGFNKSCMDPIDYISSSDIKNKFVDLCRGKQIVATINLTTGEIKKLEPRLETAEEKRPVEKKLVVVST